MEENDKKRNWAKALEKFALNLSDWVTVFTAGVLVLLGALKLFGAGIPQSVYIAGMGIIVTSLAISHITERIKSKSNISLPADSLNEIIELRKEVSLLLQSKFVREVPADAIKKQLAQLLSEATQWQFRGGSARWQRSDVLPSLSKISGRSVPYEAQIINPFKADLCARYATYRLQSGHESNGQEETAESIRGELFAFIYATAFYAVTSRIFPRVSLVSNFSPLRRDASQDAVILTVANDKMPGLMAGADGWYFTTLSDEFDVQHSDLSLRLPVIRNSPSAFTGPATKSFFQELIVLNPELGVDGEYLDKLSDEEWSAINGKANIQR